MAPLNTPTRAKLLAQVAATCFFSDTRAVPRVRLRTSVNREVRALDWWHLCSMISDESLLKDLHYTYGKTPGVKWHRTDSIRGFWAFLRDMKERYPEVFFDGVMTNLEAPIAKIIRTDDANGNAVPLLNVSKRC